MDERLKRYLDPAFRYNYTQAPNRVRSRADALGFGLNCVALAHLALRDLFGHQLPAELDCLELFYDRGRFKEVPGLDQIKPGDLAWFGIANPPKTIEEFVPRYQAGQLINWSDFPVKHVAVYAGEFNDDYLFLHATHYTGTNAVWPLAEFTNYPRYQKLYGITRLIDAG